MKSTLIESDIQCYHKINQIREIRYHETISHYKLLHPCHRQSLNTHNTISIYPEAIIEIFEKCFSQKELDFLSSLGKYLRVIPMCV